MVWGTVLTFVCMLRYWMRNVVPRGLQWNCNEVLDVRCTSADFCSPYGVQHGMPQYMRAYTAVSAAIYAVYTAGSPQSVRCNNISLQEYTKLPSSHISAQCRIAEYRSIQTQVSFFQLSTIAALYKKGPGVCRGARPCAPLRFSHIPM